jgi:hypothetical protein
MKATELRIGNYIVSGNNGKFDIDMGIGKVLEIGNEDREFEQIYCECEESFEWFFKDNYFGIPLTDEWFIKFGFYKDGEYWSKNINDYKYCFMWRDWAKNWAFYQEYTDSPNKQDEGQKYPISFDIYFVHQLQNLWFALQHEELTIKL